MKKKAVAANIPIEINQKETPTKSSGANNNVSALAAPEKTTRTKTARTKDLIFFIKNFPSVVFLDLNLNYGTKPRQNQSMALDNKLIYKIEEFFYFYLY